jgi:hypothetical protein
MTAVPPEAFDLSRELPNLQADAYAYGSQLSYKDDGSFWRAMHDRKMKYQYCIRSIGPDRWFNTIEPVYPDLILPYMPTNGTKSKGDMTFWGP